MYDELHKEKPFHDGTFQLWSEKWTPIHRFHYRDGVTIFIAEADLNPDDDFLGDPESTSW